MPQKSVSLVGDIYEVYPTINTNTLRQKVDYSDLFAKLRTNADQERYVVLARASRLGVVKTVDKR
jgi:hypothetical protein